MQTHIQKGFTMGQPLLLTESHTQSFMYAIWACFATVLNWTFGCLKCLRRRKFQRYDLFFGLIPSHSFVMVDSFPFEFIIICGLMAFYMPCFDDISMHWSVFEFIYVTSQYQNNCQRTHTRTQARKVQQNSMGPNPKKKEQEEEGEIPLYHS